MAFQSTTINPNTTSPAVDIDKIINDLAQLRLVMGGGVDPDIPMLPAQDTIRSIAIQVSAVTTAKIADLAVSAAKLADNAVTTAKLADGNITPGKLSQGAPSWSSTGQLTVTGGIVASLSSLFAQLASTGPASFASNRWSIDTGGNVQSVVPGGTTPYPDFPVRAWVNFNGATAGTNPAPMTIRASGNVSSVTRTATGLFTANFATPMPDANFAPAGSAKITDNATFGANNEALSVGFYGWSTTSISMGTFGVGAGLFNPSFVAVSVAR